MGRKSVKENKNIYQLLREEAGLTREAAAEKMPWISSDRIEKIESGKSVPHSDEILPLSECYKSPELPNYYCSHECPLGQKSVKEIRNGSLAEITLEMLATLQSLTKDRDRLIEITYDGKVSDEQLPDFLKIMNELDNMAQTISSLKLWMDKTLLEEKINRELYNTLTNKTEQ